jgi:hypothetical protein
MKGFKRKIRHISTEEEDKVLNNKKMKVSVEDEDEILEKNE